MSTAVMHRLSRLTLLVLGTAMLLASWLASAGRAEGLPGSLVDQLTQGNIWEKQALDTLLAELTPEGTNYDPLTRSFIWTLRTRKPYPGSVGVVEGKARQDVEKAFESYGLTAYFYDPLGRKVGETPLLFEIGERIPDHRFTVLSTLSLASMEGLAVRVLITVYEKEKKGGEKR